MDKLIFLNNELLSPMRRKAMHLPLEFICFGITQGKMYKHYGNRSTFTLPHQDKGWAMNVVYGALFLCKDFDFYARILDAYHLCSMSTMLTNHKQDLHHRVTSRITPIYFESTDDLKRLKYREGESIDALMYVGNLNHPKINQRLNKTVSYRIVDGIDASHFKELLGEVVK